MIGCRRHLRRAVSIRRSRLVITILVAAATTAALLIVVLSPRRAVSLPLYARQTGQPCATCHTALLELTPFGRRFKLGGYTLGGGDWSGPPFAVMLQPTYTHTQVGQEGGAAPHFGPNNNFAMQQVSLFTGGRITDNLGATIPGSLASYRDLIFFCDRSGFFMLQGGAQITPIGEQRVNNEFWSLIDQTNLARVTAAIDPANSLYAIAFPDTSASGGNPNHVFIYNWSVDRWAHVQPGALDMIFSAATQQGFTLEQLDSVSGSLDFLSLRSCVVLGV